MRDDTIRGTREALPTVPWAIWPIVAVGIALVACGPRYVDLCPIPPGIASSVPEDRGVLHVGGERTEGALTGDDDRLFMTQNHYDDWVLPICRPVRAEVFMRSDDVDSHFYLMNGVRGDDWQELMGNDDSAVVGGRDSWGCHYLRAGIYTIIATSSASGPVGDTGSYTLSVRKGATWAKCGGNPPGGV